MTSTEVYPNPTVKRVIFQIRYPNLFYIEQVIGDYQRLIINQFPESELIIQQNILFQNLGAEVRKGVAPETSMPSIETL